MTREEKLKSKGTQLDTFNYEGLIFIGKLDEAIDRYIYNNPTESDFYVWLQNNYKIIKVCIE